MSSAPIYLDCNATTPMEPEVLEILRKYLDEEYGNEGSRTHEYGARAKQAVQRARDQVGSVVGAERDEVIFTSGATESNNLAILGIAGHGEELDRKHIISTKIEHKAVIEPLEALEKRGFEITWLNSDSSGQVSPNAVSKALREDTLLVSVMAANNETGIRQPIEEIGKALGDHAAFFHTDGAQTFGKDIYSLRNPRIDMISISGHKIYGPKGIGALVIRKRGYETVPIEPLVYGGGQERGLRPGTLPVALVVALGKAAELAEKNHKARSEKCSRIKAGALAALEPMGVRFHGDSKNCMEHVINIAFPGLDSEAVMVSLKDLVAISNGSACTSSSYTPSHVLTAMGCDEDEAYEALRFSWCHMTPEIDWAAVADRVRSLS